MKTLKLTTLLILISLWSNSQSVDSSKTENLLEKIVSASVYRATGKQCDASPLITASGKRINPKNPYGHKWIAISHDLIKLFPFGTAVRVEGTLIYDGIYYVQDLMHKRWKHKIDILIGNGQKLICMKGVKLTRL
jgi:3D (Asp-Asp-Asp) domain-containing protein